MYYLINNNTKITAQLIATLFIISLPIFAFQTDVNAEELLDQSAENYRLKGYEEQQKGNLDKALTYYTKSLSLGVRNAVVYNDVGVIYEQFGIPEKAEEFYLKAIEIDKDYLAPYTNLAYLYKEQGKMDLSVKYFKERYQRASEDDPWRKKIKQELYEIHPEFKEELIRQEADQLTQEIVQKAHEEFYLSVSRSENHFQKGQQYYAEGRFSEAMLEFDRALSITPKNPKILEARRMAEYKRTIEILRQRTHRALQNLELGELEAAKKEFQHILATIPSEAYQESE